LSRTFRAILGAFLVVLVGSAGRAAAREFPQADVADEIARRIDVRDNAAVFSVFVLLNAAGYDAGTDTPMHAVRRSVRGALPRLVADTTFEKIEAYYTSRGASSDIAAYLVAAVATSGPPNFNPTFAWDDDAANRPAFRAHAQLPVLLRSFARSVRLDSIYRSQQAAHLAYTLEYTPVMRRDAATVLRYARVTSPTDLHRLGGRGRTIVIPSLLMARGASVSFMLDTTFYIVEGPQNLAAFAPHEIIRAVTYRATHDAKHAALVRKAAAAFDGAKGRTALRHASVADFVEANLVAAITLRYREDRRDSDGSGAMAMEYVRAGLVLVPYFSHELIAYEGQSESLRTYFPKLLESLDGARELARWRDSIRQ
jgi:hypothetical protein